MILVGLSLDVHCMLFGFSLDHRLPFVGLSIFAGLSLACHWIALEVLWTFVTYSMLVACSCDRFFCFVTQIQIKGGEGKIFVKRGSV